MTNPATDNSPDALLLLLNNATQNAARARRRRWWWLSLLVLSLLAAWGYFATHRETRSGQYLSEPAQLGDLTVTVSASGTLQPTSSVDVGSEQSGTLASVLVQENDYVKQGQLLAQLNTDKLKDAVTRSRAALASAKAAVAVARATVAESKAALARMRQVAKLSGGKVPAKTELDAAEATWQRALANETSTHATVTQAEAALKTDETNLSKATIRSPVDGVVLARKVEPGQSVVAAMNIPVLFTLAEDLAQMELQVKVDEADVGNVKLGQPATFTVSAWPGRAFPATIQRVGLGSTITDNVVTYKTVLTVANPDLALRPGMTATASIVTAQREKALLVPNAALRFSPPQAAEAEQEGGFVARLLPRLPKALTKKQQNPAQSGGAAQVWTLDPQQQPQAIPVQIGVSNGRLTEIVGGALQAGMAVITEYQEAKP